MRLSLLTLLATMAIATFAQTTSVLVDWRYRLTWTDPNLPGLVGSWLVYASNSVSNVRSTTTTNLTTDLQPLLNGAVAGTYHLFTVPVSKLGDVGDRGDILTITWPGGNGRLRGGLNLGATK